MHLIKLVTRNFKKLSGFTANFADGLNVIVGENAQGKSTLLQAIEAALFGVTVVPGKKENIPTWGQNNFSLELTFEVAGDTYVLTRTKSTAKLVAHRAQTEELVANGNTPVTAYIEQLLGLTAKDFNLFVQSKQGETAGVLTFGATALNQKVEEYAGVSLIDSVAKRANEVAAEQRAIASANEVDGAELDEAVSERANAEERLQAATLALANAEQALQDLAPVALTMPSPTAQQLTEQRRKADRHAASLKDAKSELALAAQAVTAAAEALAAAGTEVDIEDLQERHDAAKKTVQQLRSQAKQLASEVADAKAAAKALESALSDVADAAAAYTPDELERAKQAAAGATEAQREAADHAAVLSSRISDMEAMQEGAVCPTCNSRLSEHDPAALAAELATLRAALKDAEETKRTARRQAADEGEVVAKQTQAANALRSATARLGKAEAAAAAVRQGIRDEAAKVAAALESEEASLATLTAQLTSAEETNERVRAAWRRLTNAENKLDETRDLVSDLEAQQFAGPSDVEIDTAAQAEAAYREAEREYEREKSLRGNAIALARAELSSAKTVAAHAEAEVARLARSAERGAEARTLMDKAARLARFLRERRQTYLQEIWQAVLGAASRQVVTASRGLITRIVNKDGEFLFEEDGVLAPVASASGAQKAFIGSAVRIGLTRTLYGRDSLLIFDEPTESMSERNASGLAASLSGAASQLLLITHREQDQSLAANIIQVGA